MDLLLEKARLVFGEQDWSAWEWSADVLTCPSCGATRRVVAVVLRSSTAQAILQHLRLPSRPLPLAPATSPAPLGFW